MRRVASKNTQLEINVRKLVYSLGYRYRLHRKDLPGTPDLAFISRKKVIFINGCFWHGHKCARGDRLPKTNTEYWKNKIERNIQRDSQNMKLFEKIGWKVLVVWECQIKVKEILEERLKTFLE